MALQTKPLSEITHRDVVDFCDEAHEENLTLDYKEDFPRDLADLMCAFANTYGGIVVIGVKEQDGIPVKPYQGIDYDKGLAERVWNINVDNITPPIRIEVGVCPPDKNNKTFVVARIPQSQDVPHAVAGKRRVYIRTGVRNKPYELADLDLVEHLLEQRRGGATLSRQLLKEAEERCALVSSRDATHGSMGELVISASPAYPRGPLVPARDLMAHVGSIAIHDNQSRRLPPTYTNYSPIQDGIVHTTKDHAVYCEFNRFGTIFYRTIAAYQRAINAETAYIVYLWELLAPVEMAIELCAELYPKLSYWGQIDFRVSLSELSLVRFYSPLRAGFDSDYKPLPQHDFRWERQFSVQEVIDRDRRKEISFELLEDICWSFGSDVNERILTAWFKQRDRLKQFGQA